MTMFRFSSGMPASLKFFATVRSDADVRSVPLAPTDVENPGYSANSASSIARTIGSMAAFMYRSIPVWPAPGPPRIAFTASSRRNDTSLCWLSVTEMVESVGCCNVTAPPAVLVLTTNDGGSGMFSLSPSLKVP